MRDDQVSDARNEHDGRAEREVLSTIGEERQLNVNVNVVFCFDYISI